MNMQDIDGWVEREIARREEIKRLEDKIESLIEKHTTEIVERDNKIRELEDIIKSHRGRDEFDKMVSLAGWLMFFIVTIWWIF